VKASPHHFRHSAAIEHLEHGSDPAFPLFPWTRTPARSSATVKGVDCRCLEVTGAQDGERVLSVAGSMDHFSTNRHSIIRI
jgi:hypothetical protein